MKEKCRVFCTKYKFHILVLVLITLLGSFYISQKEGYHMDELLSFELSNAEFTPWIVTTQPQGRLEKFVQNEIYGDSFGETMGNLIANVKDVLKNRGSSKLLSYKADVYEEPQWITAEEFRDYLTTDSRDNFNYLSVYFNVKDDNHPPLHFMLLHTVSSIFQGQIHPWMGCIINLILLWGICILLMKIGSDIFGNTWLGMAASILYGFSMAGMSTLLLIRMYALLTFWCVFALYLHLKKLKTGDFRYHNKLLILVTVCGFVTQYYFVIFMLFLAMSTIGVIAYQEKKTRWKKILYYIRTMAIAAVIGLCLFPFSIADVLYSGRGVESVQNLGGGLSGMGERFWNFFQILRDRIFGNSLVMLVTVLALLAGTVYRTVQNAKERNTAKTENVGTQENFVKAVDLGWLVLPILVPALCYMLLVTKIAPYYADRYMMPVFPILALLLALWMTNITNILTEKYRCLVILLAVMIILPGLLTQKPQYLYQGYQQQVDLAAEYQDLDCLCVYDGVGYYQNLIEFTQYRQTLMVTKEELLSRSQDAALESDQELVVLVEGSVDAAPVEQYLQEKYGYTMTKTLLSEGVHGDRLYLYQK